jgi:hypothetical protein
MANSRLVGLAFVSVVVVIAGALAAAPKAAPGAHPVVWASYSYLIGGSVDARWKGAEEIAPLLKGGERYRLYTMTKLLGEGTGSKPAESEEEATVFRVLELKITPCPDAEGEIVGVCGNWNALPRVPTLQSTSQKVYQDVIRALLNRKGFPGSPVKIIQILRVDLEGDGQDEVLITASTIKTDPLMPGHKQGDYSLVLLRKIVKGQVKEILLTSELHKKSEDFSAPMVFEVVGVLDLDGDGVMEIVTRERYYEGMSLCVYAVKGAEGKMVLSGGWGA